MDDEGEPLFGQRIDAPPDAMNGTNVLSRFIDGVGFRYYWATEGLRDEDFSFRPIPASMSMHELLKHIQDLVLMVRQAIRNETYRADYTEAGPAEIRNQTLNMLSELRDELRRADDAAVAEHRVLKRDGKDWPIWHIMNGPISDALTHIGQIVSWRRINGNPQAKVNVFMGWPPRAS